MSIATKQVLNLPINAVKPNPYQPRRIFDQNGLDELAASIKVYGVLQPITVRYMDHTGTYEIVAGERRLRASRQAGLNHVPAILMEMSDTDSAVIAIIENLQRRDLHFFEEALGFRNLMYDYNFTQEELAAKVGKNQSTIANKLRLLKLPGNLQKLIVNHGLTERHTRALLRIPHEKDQTKLLDKIIDEGLNVRKTEALIEAMLKPKAKTKAKSPKTIPFKAYIKDIRILTNSIKEDLEIMRYSGMDTNLKVEETSTGYSINITLDYRQDKPLLLQAK